MRLSLVILATIASYLAMHHLLLAIRRKESTYWWFSVLALALAVHDLMLRIRLDVSDLETHILMHKLQWSTEILGLWLLQAFFASYSRLKTTRLQVVSGVLIGCFFLWNLVRPYGMNTSGKPELIQRSYPWGETFYSLDLGINLDYKLFVLLIVFILGSCLWMGWQGWRQKHYKRSLAMLAALSLIVMAILHSIVRDIYDLSTPQLIDHSFVGLLVLMSFILSDEVVKASQLQVSLEKKERHLATTLNAIGEAVIVLDGVGTVMNMNPAAARMLQVPLSEVQGRLLSEFIELQDPSGAVIGMPGPRLKSAGCHHLKTDVILDLKKEDHQTHATETAACMLDQSGEPNGIVTVYHDQTDRMEMEERLRHGQKLEALGQLAGGVAHDFNNMLGGIIGAAELLNEEVHGQEEAEAYVSLIVGAADHAADLTSQLLAFSRKGKQLSTPIDIHEVLDSVLRILEHSIDRRVRIKKQLNASYASVVGDPTQLQNALINLGLNSRDAMPDGGVLQFETSHVELDLTTCEKRYPDLEPGTYLCIQVIDQGSGISQENLERIFEPFFTTKSEGKGTGLGLAAVYGTIRDHGGAIEVESLQRQNGGGTTFTLLLPLSYRPKVAPGTIENAIIPAEPHSGMVLLIDDEGLLRHTGARLLEGMGYEVMQAADGEEGVSCFKRYYDKIEIVLLDMVMPEMNGEEAYREMRAWESECFKEKSGQIHRKPILMCSGFARNTSISRLMEAGLDGFIQKPFRRLELVEAINKLVGGRQSK